RAVHPFPTRRSSDLLGNVVPTVAVAGEETALRKVRLRGDDGHVVAPGHPVARALVNARRGSIGFWRKVLGEKQDAHCAGSVVEVPVEATGEPRGQVPPPCREDARVGNGHAELRIVTRGLDPHVEARIESQGAHAVALRIDQVEAIMPRWLRVDTGVKMERD